MSDYWTIIKPINVKVGFSAIIFLQLLQIKKSTMKDTWGNAVTASIEKISSFESLPISAFLQIITS